MKKFIFLEHTADSKFQAFGKTLEKCFENSAVAMATIQADVNTIKAKQKITLEVKAENAEKLLHKFLEEILFQTDTKEMLFSKFKIKINKQKNYLKAELFGEKIDSKKHKLKTLVKAVTWNSFFLRKEKEVWVAQVVCDT